MSWPTMQDVLILARKAHPKLVDITGGAPEYNPDLKRFVKALRTDGHKVQVRTNLTIWLEPGMEDMIGFYKEAAVKLVASLPCYMRPEVDNVRGKGVFDKSLKALKLLNKAGYGKDKDLVVDLVFNHEEDSLPPETSELQKEYEQYLTKDLGLFFNKVFTITNMPVGRFWAWLKQEGKDTAYLKLIKGSFNPATVGSLMCRNQIDIGFDGSIYDCDFNLAAGLKVGFGTPTNIKDFDPVKHSKRKIVTAQHCFGCTAGHGSSCSGSLEK
jgi:radical SAM/Cys-rich protein